MKAILKIISIITFFSLVSYTLTYPYELAYSGEEGIVLIEESYESNSLEQLINRPEFKDKVLYITLGNLLESEVIKVKKEDYDNTNKNFKDNRIKIFKASEFKTKEYRLKKNSELYERYAEKDFILIHLSIPYYVNQKKDALRNWKTEIKESKIKGTHCIMSPDLLKKMNAKIKNTTTEPLFPHAFIINKQGEIIYNNAPSPSYEYNKLCAVLDSIINQ